MPDLHRHDHFSLFDGFGKPAELAIQAKEKGYTALGIANHGTISGLAQHYAACVREEIKPILGVEAYFQPVLNKEAKRYHLCLFVKNLKGYQNLNRLMLLAERQKYYKPLISFENLEKYNEGLICSSACINNFLADNILSDNFEGAVKAAKKFKKIFGEDYYIELQPYKIDNKKTQERLNEGLMKLAEQLNIKCILTSDSHFGDKSEFETYKIMHEIGRKSFDQHDIEDTYGERYMPTYKELIQRFTNLHGDKEFAKQCIRNLKEIENKVEDKVLDQLELNLPKLHEDVDSNKALQKKLVEGLKRRGKYCKKEYMDRTKEEFEVIKHHGFADYFMIVEDYVNWAKSQGIGVGPGRGSVCNSLVAYLLGITEVDSVYFNLDFRRFLRLDKKSFPDIDLDFETARRTEVLEYVLNKYKGKSAQIGSYGLYKVDNLLNDLAKVCGMEEKSDLDSLKKFIKNCIGDEEFEYNDIKDMKETIYYNKAYNNILFHFSKLYRSIRYLGTHAAGVVVTGTSLLDYSGIRIVKDENRERYSTVYDLSDAEKVNIIKFDILGLKTVEQITELEKLTGKKFEYSWLEDEKILTNFREGNTDGIFQFEKKAAKEILKNIHADCFEDVTAASSMNRPGPLQMKMPEIYADNKANPDFTHNIYYDYTKETYGTIVYQEQLMQICRNIGKLSWEMTDKTMKMMKTGSMVEAARQRILEMFELVKAEFVKGAIENGVSENEAAELFSKLIVYTFNKGHAVGYTIISFQEMFYKTYYPTEFWYSKVKNADKENEYLYRTNAVKDGNILFLPHVNYSADASIRIVDGQKVIQEGTSAIKFVGSKAAKFIEAERLKNGPFKSEEEFMKRVKDRSVNKRTIEELKKFGALDFNKASYQKRVIKYNSTYYMKGLQNG